MSTDQATVNVEGKPSSHGAWPHQLRLLRWLLLAFGAVAIATAVLVDFVTKGEPGFGVSQFVLLFAGLGSLVLAHSGRRIVDHYKVTVLIIANTIIMLLLLNLAAVLTRSVWQRKLVSSSQPRGHWLDRVSLYHTRMPWFPEYQRERAALFSAYSPYVIWRYQPFEGKAVRVGPDHLRRTPGANCDAESFLVFTFGGSTMWGMGVPDWGTIPAYLQADLAERLNRPVCVVNYAEPAYVSTQSVIALIRTLQSGARPDLVIFYDGVNEPVAAATTGLAGGHYDLQQITRTLGPQPHPLGTWLKSWAMVSFVMRLNPPDPESATPPAVRAALQNVDSLGRAVAHAYLTNYETVSALADRFGFKYAFFWQPSIATTHKQLTAEETEIKGLMSGPIVTTLLASYPLVEAEAGKRKYLHSITDLYADQKDQVWFDWFHVTAEANRLAATRILELMQADLPIGAKSRAATSTAEDH